MATIDFDARRLERDREPFTILVGGHEYEIAPELPAEVAFDAARLHEAQEAGHKFKPGEIGEIASVLFGKPVYDALLSVERLSVADLGDLIKAVIDEYNRRAGNVPNRATRRAQKRSNPST